MAFFFAELLIGNFLHRQYRRVDSFDMNWLKLSTSVAGTITSNLIQFVFTYVYFYFFGPTQTAGSPSAKIWQTKTHTYTHAHIHTESHAGGHSSSTQNRMTPIEQSSDTIMHEIPVASIVVDVQTHTNTHTYMQMQMQIYVFAT